MAQRIFLRKNDLSKNDKLPYFTLFLLPEENAPEGTEWPEVGALWKAKSGNGYSGKTVEAAEITIDASKTFKKKEKGTTAEEEGMPDHD